MKKYIIAIFMSIFLISCSALSIIDKYNVPNSEVKKSVAAKVNGSQDFIVVKGTSTVEDVYVENNKLQVVIKLEVSNVLSAIFLPSATTEMKIYIETGIKYRDGKLYTNNIKIKKITGILDQAQIKQISNGIVYTLLDNNEIYDFRSKGINPNLIEDVYIGENNIVVDFK